MDILKFFKPFEMTLAEAGMDQLITTCPFCGHRKLYISKNNGVWDCKHAFCNQSGNLYSFMDKIWEKWREDNLGDWNRFGEDRGLKPEDLISAGFVWGANRWWLPIRNAECSIISMQHYQYGGKLIITAGTNNGIYGAEKLNLKRYAKARIWICEGAWDAIALKRILKDAGITEDLVISIPGAKAFKGTYASILEGRRVFMCFDADKDGHAAHRRIISNGSNAEALYELNWPFDVPDGTDVRDFYRSGGTYEELMKMIDAVDPAMVDRLAIVEKAEKDTICFDELVEHYRKWLHLTPELVDAIRVTYALVLSNRILGDPLWMFIVSPPGGCKTEILTSLLLSPECIVRSTVTPHSLISGFKTPDGADPSLLPKLAGKVFILKDFTEILQMNPNARDEVYSILRGAYDGRAEKSFGNGIERVYKCHFSMVAGVTPAIYASRGASMGERFLNYHVVRGRQFDATAEIKRAMANVGKENEMREELQTNALRFLSREYDPDTIPDLNEEQIDVIISLAQVVAMLRAQVARDREGDNLLYRPQHEVGTRLAKQLKKLLLGLSMLHKTPQVTASDLQLIRRIATDTCVGFCIDIVQTLADLDHCSVREISQICEVPTTTIRATMEDLEILGVVSKDKTPVMKVGRPEFLYRLTQNMKSHYGTLTGKMPKF